MKTTKQFKRKPLANLIAMALVSTSVIGGVAYAAAPLAGTEIKNLATVSYEDENGNTYTAQSNEAIITVAPQYRATLENDRVQNAAPGQTVYFPHTLVNTGNTADTYALAVTNGATIYLDTNSNGQPDPGENPVTQVTLNSGDSAQLIVAYDVSVSATNQSTESVVLTATSSGTNAIVKDTGTNGDSDTDDNSATNDDLVTVTTGPVLVLTKNATFDEVNHKITYTLTVSNTGGSNAELVDIIDALPRVDHDNDNGAVTAEVPLLNPTIISINGLLTSNGDTVPALGAATLTTADEVALGADIDGDGNISNTSVAVIKATDAVLAPNTSVSIEYSADYDPAWHADISIDNTFITSSDDDGDVNTPKITTSSNTTHNTIPQLVAVVAEDDSVNPAVPSPGVNDGNDDDSAPVNDIQFVDVVSAGSTVVFTHTITNTGNGDDTFDLSVANTNFPAATLFTFWSADGSVPLNDTNGGSIPDTGVIASGADVKIVVKAVLPASESGSPVGGYVATLTATSTVDGSVSDTTSLNLGAITAPAVDLAAVTTDANDAITSNNASVFNSTAQDSAGFNDGGTANAHDEGPVIFANDAAVGSTVSFPMSIANESGSSDSFLLSAIDLPAGWTVEFKNASNQTITATDFIPAGGTFNYTAYVTLSSDPAQSESDSPRATDVDGFDNLNGAGALVGADGDNDYNIIFKVASASDSTRYDTITHAVDVATTPSVTITPDGQNQIQPGGTIDYPHRLQNYGNVNESIELIASDSATSWTSKLLIDTNGDGVGDTELGSLTSGTTIDVFNNNGTTTPATLTDLDGDGLVEFPLTPGQYVKFTNRVFAPSTAAQGAVNSTLITAQDQGASETVRNTATDTSNVILGQVRLDKTVALQADCTTPPVAANYQAIQSATVEPGQCAVWQIVATNEGTAVVKNVVIKDNIPAYTTSMAGTLEYCEGLNCTPASVSDTAGNDAGEIVNDLVTFYVGAGSTPASSTGGELQPGQTATVRFTVKVDQ